MQVARQIADFVEEQRAVVGSLDASDLALVGTGKGALFIAEQLGLDQCRRNRRTVDRYERPLAPWRQGMQQPRHHFLAGAGLPGYQHADIGGGYLADVFLELEQAGALADEIAEIDRLRDLAVLLSSGKQLCPPVCTPQRHHQPLRVVRQGVKVIEPVVQQCLQGRLVKTAARYCGNPVDAGSRQQAADLVVQPGNLHVIQAEQSHGRLVQLAGLRQPVQSCLGNDFPAVFLQNDGKSLCFNARIGNQDTTRFHDFSL